MTHLRHRRQVPISEVMERGAPRRTHSTLMFAARITLLYFSVSSAMSLAKSPGEPDSVLPPRSANRALTFESARAELISVLSCWTNAAGVFSTDTELDTVFASMTQLRAG